MQVLRDLNKIASSEGKYLNKDGDYTYTKIDGVVKYTKEKYDLVKATPGSVGYDLCANIPSQVILGPGTVHLIPTGIRIQLPAGFEAQIRPRSGLASRYRITVINAPGTIDSDYRGELSVALINYGLNSFPISPGDRIAQLVFAKVPYMILEETTDPLSSTSRGEGGFGSTGI